jgi:hypothetical protein
MVRVPADLWVHALVTFPKADMLSNPLDALVVSIRLDSPERPLPSYLEYKADFSYARVSLSFYGCSMKLTVQMCRFQ